jgi:urease accessory protein
MSDPLLALLQFSDGLFPAGGFAHSFGLESYVQDGRVSDAAGVEAFVTAHLEGSAGPADGVAVAVSSRLGRAGDAAGALELDRHVDAMKVVPEFRAASRQMGRQTLRVAAAIAADPFLRELERAADDGRSPGHHAVAFGVALGRSGVDAAPAVSAFLYSTAAMLAGAALRLMPLGQIEAQRVVARVRPTIERLARQAAVATIEDMWSFAPAIEIAGIRHAALDARLFRS